MEHDGSCNKSVRKVIGFVQHVAITTSNGGGGAHGLIAPIMIGIAVSVAIGTLPVAAFAIAILARVLVHGDRVLGPRSMAVLFQSAGSMAGRDLRPFWNHSHLPGPRSAYHMVLGPSAPHEHLANAKSDEHLEP